MFSIRHLFLIAALLLFICIVRGTPEQMKMSNKFPIAADRIRDEPESVWVEFIQIALDHKPLNFGQGFPDFAAPTHVTSSLANVTNGTEPLMNQYTRSFGHPRLVKALSRLYSKYMNRDIDPMKEIVVTVGAYEALFISITAFVNPGDEVIVIEPFFDCYPPMIKMANGKVVYVPLREANTTSNGTITSSWKLDPKEFESKFSEKTRVLILNNPNNPLGKVYSRDELEMIANLCIKYNVLVIADEVYEQMYYPPNVHVRIAELPGMWERTITVGSAGKTFSVTGWKIGWAYGPSHLIRYAQLVHQTAVYTVATPLQEAVAQAFELEIERLDTPDNYWRQLRSDLEYKRDRMASILIQAGMKPIIPQGGYFMLADFTYLAKQFPEYQNEIGQTNDHKFAKWLAKRKGLQGIPPYAFYGDEHKNLSSKYIRFCFIKKNSSLDQLESVIRRIKSSL